MNEVTIYGLHAPNGSIRYIGKTSRSLSIRLSEHIRHAKNSAEDNYRLRWIRKLLRNGQQPEVMVLEYVSRDKWKEAERKWIALYKKAGFALVNGDNGGNGGSTEEIVKRGEEHYRSKLTRGNVVELCEKYATGKYSQERLAEEYGVTASNINLLIRGKTWKHVKRPIIRAREEGFRQKLIQQDVIEIAEKYAQGGYTQSQLAEKYGVCPNLIHEIVTGKRYQYIKRPITHAANGDIEIVRHRSSTHRQPRGEQVTISKLIAEQVKTIRKEYIAGGITQCELGYKYGVNQQCISAIINRKTWRHIE